MMLVLFTSCTQDDPSESPNPKPAATFPKPAESIDEASKKIEEAVSDPTCAKLGALIHPYLKPSDPARQQEQCMGFLPLLKGFEKIAAKEYGTGGVIDYRFQDQGGKVQIQSLLMALDKEKRFKLFALEGEFASPTTGTTPKNVKNFDSTAKSAVAAIRKGDCDALYELTHKGLAPGGQDKVEFCSQYANSGLQKALQLDAEATTIRMGANATYGFYALAVKPDRYYTVVIALQDDEPKFVSEIRMLDDQLTKVGACQEFIQIVSDLTLSDEQSAQRFNELANRTQDLELAEALRRVAKGFAERSPSVSSAEVQTLCK